MNYLVRLLLLVCLMAFMVTAQHSPSGLRGHTKISVDVTIEAEEPSIPAEHEPQDNRMIAEIDSATANRPVLSFLAIEGMTSMFKAPSVASNPIVVPVNNVNDFGYGLVIAAKFQSPLLPSAIITLKSESGKEIGRFKYDTRGAVWTVNVDRSDMAEIPPTKPQRYIMNAGNGASWTVVLKPVSSQK